VHAHYYCELSPDHPLGHILHRGMKYEFVFHLLIFYDSTMQQCTLELPDRTTSVPCCRAATKACTPNPKLRPPNERICVTPPCTRSYRVLAVSSIAVRLIARNFFWGGTREAPPFSPLLLFPFIPSPFPRFSPFFPSL